MIICRDCGKEEVNESKGRCLLCYRKHQRKIKPSIKINGRKACIRWREKNREKYNKYMRDRYHRLKEAK